MKLPASSCARFLVLAAFLQPGVRAADTPVPPEFTLVAAVQRALTQSPAVRIQQVEVDRREGVREQATGEFDWTTSATVTRDHARTPAVDAAGRDTVDDSEATAYSVAVARKFRNGVIVQPSVDVVVAEPGHPAGPDAGSSELNLQIVVPLLRGLGAASTGASEAAARGDVEVARLLYRHQLSAQALAIVEAYWSARAAEAAVGVQHDDERRAQKLHEGIRVLVDTRIFAPSLLLQSEANLRQKSTSSRNAELEAQSARYALARVIGLPAAELADVPAPSDPLPASAAVLATATGADRTRWITRALNRRADYLASRQSQVPLQLLARQAELDLKPRLDLNVSGGYAGLDAGRSLLSPLSRRLTGANGRVGLSFDWPVANTYRRGVLRARRAEERQAELSTAQVQTDVAADVCLTLEEVRLRAETMRNAAATAEIARKAVEQEQRKLQTGEASVLDVINLENLLSSARLSEIDAQAGYAIAVARLRYAVGEIFTADQTDRSFQLHNLTTPPDEN